ncbi:ATP-binding protein [Nocardioides immobilis]|uniref:ATP-binding protein n=1 Tax=Nocardioides immobilis TaxID=2049295 RepID=UPI0015FD90D9|nr:LuxR C-terminal-related transcriptional regulator [Nocardioides immobilis]
MKRLMTESRLVTLTGVGGVGKTRLAIHVARQVHLAFADGVRLVTLADLATPELLPTMVLSAVSISGSASAGVDEVAEQLADRELLLLLDNCEHLADACAHLVTTLLQRCPGLRVLATSRERLRVDGEVVYVVPPLPLPTEDVQLQPGDILRYDALALFVDRASALHADRSPGIGDIDAENVARLCRRLDGLPLAIELLAARTAAIPLQVLADRPDDQLPVLSMTGSRSAPVRHHTLRAAIEYSYELCSEPARLLWSRLSVFAGGATLESVLDVCADGVMPCSEVEAALTELVDKSIVAFDADRYRMLATIRAFGSERLRALGDELVVRSAHRDHFAAMTADPVGAAWPPATWSRLRRLAADHANLRAALEFCLSDRSEYSAGLHMASRMWTFWTGCGLGREGRHWLGELLAVSQEASSDRVTGLWVDGCLAAVDGDHGHALRRAEECASLAAALGDAPGIAHAKFVWGMARLFGGHAEDAISDLQAAVELERELPAPNPVLPTSLMVLGMAGCLAGSLDLARETLTEACELAQACGEELVESWARLYVGLLALLEGRQDDAVVTLRGVLADHRMVDDVGAMSIAVELLAWAAMDLGDDVRAAELMGVSNGLAVAVAQLAGLEGLRSWHHDRVTELKKRLGSREFERAVNQGIRRPAGDAISFALEESTTSSQPLRHDDTWALTAREQQIALLVAQGQTNKQIASHLVISPRTAEGHVQSILAKLGFTSRAQIAAAFARRTASPNGTDVRA